MSHWISVFLLLINAIVIKYVSETLISLLQVEICNMRLSISYFDQTLGKRESQTWQGFNFPGIWLRDFVVLILFAGTNYAKMVKNRENCKF